MKRIKRYLIAGILVWAPILVTVFVLKFLVGFFDDIINLLPKAYHPEVLLGFSIPGLGLIFTILLVFITGMLVTNFLGKRIVAIWEAILNRIPLVRSIYSGVKKVLSALFVSGGMSFRKVLLIEYPRKGLWSIAFQTGSGFTKAEQKTGEELITAFVPTTPNPTSGFLIMVPSKDVIELDITVDDALKMVISLGVILPGNDVPEYD